MNIWWNIRLGWSRRNPLDIDRRKMNTMTVIYIGKSLLNGCKEAARLRAVKTVEY